MAKKPITPIDPDLAPTQGGSYLRDPDTGTLTRVEGPPIDDDTPAESAATTAGTEAALSPSPQE